MQIDVFIMTDTTVTVPTPSIDGNRPRRLTVGIIIGILFLLVLGVAAAIVVLYVVRRRQSKVQYLTGGKDSGKSHGIGKAGFCPVHNIFD